MTFKIASEFLCSCEVICYLPPPASQYRLLVTATEKFQPKISTRANAEWKGNCASSPDRFTTNTETLVHFSNASTRVSQWYHEGIIPVSLGYHLDVNRASEPFQLLEASERSNFRLNQVTA
jgi:hypothetical protein